MSYTVRLATPDDAATLSAIATRTFHHMATTTHADTVQADDLAVYLAAAYPVEKMRTEIEDPLRTTAFIFPANDPVHPCGYVMLSDCSIRPGDADDQAVGTLRAEDYLEVKRVYVDAEYFGTGAAHVMMQHAMEIIKQKNRKIVWVGTGPDNYRAQKFYNKFGFVLSGKRYFTVGTVSHLDIVLTLEPPSEQLSTSKTSSHAVSGSLPQAVSS